MVKRRSKRSRLDLLGLRQEVEDPAAAVVDHDEPQRRPWRGERRRGRRGRGPGRGRRARPRSAPRRRAPGRRRWRPGRRCRWRRDWRGSAPRRRARAGTPRRRGPACSTPAAPARRPRTPRRGRGAARLADAALLAQHLVDRRLRGSLGAGHRSPQSSSAVVVDPLGERQRDGSRVGADDRSGSPGRLVPPPRGVDDDLVDAAAGDPARSGLQVGMSPKRRTRSGASASGRSRAIRS